MGPFDRSDKRNSLHGSLSVAFSSASASAMKFVKSAKSFQSLRPSHSDTAITTLAAPVAQVSRKLSPLTAQGSSWLDSTPATPLAGIDEWADEPICGGVGLPTIQLPDDPQLAVVRELDELSHEMSLLMASTSSTKLGTVKVTSSSGPPSCRGEIFDPALSPLQVADMELSLPLSLPTHVAGHNSVTDEAIEKEPPSLPELTFSRAPTISDRRNTQKLCLKNLQPPESSMHEGEDSPTIPAMWTIGGSAPLDHHASTLSDISQSLSLDMGGRVELLSSPELPDASAVAAAMPLASPALTTVNAGDEIISSTVIPSAQHSRNASVATVEVASANDSESDITILPIQAKALSNAADRSSPAAVETRLPDTMSFECLRPEAPPVGSEVPACGPDPLSPMGVSFPSVPTISVTQSDRSLAKGQPKSQPESARGFQKPAEKPRSKRLAKVNCGIPTGVRPKYATGVFTQTEIQLLKEQAIEQATRFEVLTYDQVLAMSGQVRTLDERCDFLRKSYRTLQSDRRRLQAKIVGALAATDSPIAPEALRKQAQGLLELDLSIEEWFQKLERAENGRLRLRQKLLEHVAAACQLQTAVEIEAARVQAQEPSTNLPQSTPPLTPDTPDKVVTPIPADGYVVFRPVAREDSPRLLRPVRIPVTLTSEKKKPFPLRIGYPHSWKLSRPGSMRHVSSGSDETKTTNVASKSRSGSTTSADVSAEDGSVSRAPVSSPSSASFSGVPIASPLVDLPFPLLPPLSPERNQAVGSGGASLGVIPARTDSLLNRLPKSMRRESKAKGGPSYSLMPTVTTPAAIPKPGRVGLRPRADSRPAKPLKLGETLLAKIDERLALAAHGNKGQQLKANQPG